MNKLKEKCQSKTIGWITIVLKLTLNDLKVVIKFEINEVLLNILHICTRRQRKSQDELCI